MIALQDVHKSYHLGEIDIPVLRGVSLFISRGEFVAIMGPSGSGKSTLLNLIGCLDRLDSGTYRLSGLPIEQLKHESDLAIAYCRQLVFGGMLNR